jgi:hypothetical protein
VAGDKQLHRLLAVHGLDRFKIAEQYRLQLRMQVRFRLLNDEAAVAGV